MEMTVITVAAIAYLAFLQWMRHHRRILIHRERIAAIEKGVSVPPLEQEVQRSTWNVQRILLLLGWSWVAVGVGAFVVLSVLLTFPANTRDIPQGMQYIGLVALGIGIAHLITYRAGAKRGH